MGGFYGAGLGVKYIILLTLCCLRLSHIKDNLGMYSSNLPRKEANIDLCDVQSNLWLSFFESEICD